MRARALLLALVAASGTGASVAHAQERSGRALTFVPSVGFAAIADNGHVASGGMPAVAEMEIRSGRAALTAYAATRGIGVSCSDGCDRGGQSLGAYLSLAAGPLGLGAGIGALHRSAGWRAQPHGRVWWDRGLVRLQVRVEVPDGWDDVHVPLLVGLRMPVG